MVSPVSNIASKLCNFLYHLFFLDNVIVCKKGIIDIISDGITSYYVSIEGSDKRCGGQGDIFSGVLGTFVKFQNNLTSIQSESERAILSVVAASIVTRSSARRGFLKKKIGLTSPDILEEIPYFLAEVYDD
jgi:ATP-dependent NAD(P)H-hydrate dehydratase